MINQIICFLFVLAGFVFLAGFLIHLGNFIDNLRDKEQSLVCTIIDAVASAISGIVAIGLAVFIFKAQTYKYTDVFYEIKNTEVSYQVNIDSFEKAKGEEGTYKVTLTSKSQSLRGLLKHVESFSDKATSTCSDLDILHISLSESEYEELIGSGNNLFRIQLSSLSFKTEKHLFSAEKTTLYRIEPFSSPFTEEDAQELSDVFLKEINDKITLKKAYNNTMADIAVSNFYY